MDIQDCAGCRLNDLHEPLFFCFHGFPPLLCLDGVVWHCHAYQSPILSLAELVEEATATTEPGNE